MAARDDYIVQQLKKLDALDTLNTKIDNIATSLNQLTTQVNSIQSSVDSNTADIAKNSTAIAELRAELQQNKLDVKSLKTSHNQREQRLRATTIRLFNFPVILGESVDNYRPLATRVYDKVLKPALVAARAAGDVGSVSQQQNCVEACFRAFSPKEPPPGAAPPPIIIRLVSNAIKFAVMKNRKHIPAPVEDSQLGVKRYVLVEDLTPEALSLFRSLQRDERTEKVWTLNGVIHYTKPGISGFSKVKNIFDPLDTILGVP